MQHISNTWRLFITKNHHKIIQGIKEPKIKRSSERSMSGFINTFIPEDFEMLFSQTPKLHIIQMYLPGNRIKSASFLLTISQQQSNRQDIMLRILSRISAVSVGGWLYLWSGPRALLTMTIHNKSIVTLIERTQCGKSQERN